MKDMKKYLLTLAALSLVFAAEARKPKNARSRTAAKNSEVIAADSVSYTHLTLPTNREV